jgi:hypothetical protein
VGYRELTAEITEDVGVGKPGSLHLFKGKRTGTMGVEGVDAVVDLIVFVRKGDIGGPAHQLGPGGEGDDEDAT